MKLGLLLCDHVLPEFRSVAGDYDEMFARWLPGEWQVFDLTAGNLPRHTDECAAWVSTGSRYSVYDEIPWIQAFRDFVRDLHQARKPFLGVCFGHQMIGHALGGSVRQSPRGWGVGNHRFAVRTTTPWMEPPAAAVRLLMSCRDQIEQVPPGAATLAGNEHCPVGIIQMGAALGIQGHPEWEPAYAAALLRNRRERIGPELADAALATLEGPADSQLLRDWALAFCRHHA